MRESQVVRPWPAQRLSVGQTNEEQVIEGWHPAEKYQTSNPVVVLSGSEIWTCPGVQGKTLMGSKVKRKRKEKKTLRHILDIRWLSEIQNNRWEGLPLKIVRCQGEQIGAGQLGPLYL